jgi:hypothetical protein
VEHGGFLYNITFEVRNVGYNNDAEGTAKLPAYYLITQNSDYTLQICSKKQFPDLPNKLSTITQK